MKLPLTDVVAAASAQIRRKEDLPEEAAFSTDTRTLEPGDLFVALRGEHFDGHAFIGEAMAKGAAGAVVDDAAALGEHTPGLIVRQTTRAYLDFAGVARRRLNAQVAAITGSTGKTTTKALLAQILECRGGQRVAATPANENNEIGVAKLFLSLDEDIDVVVVEFGARHYGEIEPLARIAWPDVAVLTNIGDAHLEIMGSRARLAETKFGIFATGAQPILCRDDTESRRRAPALARLPEWFDVFRTSDEHPSSRPRSTTAIVEDVESADVSLVRYGHEGGMRASQLDLHLRGYHNRWNLAAAAAAAHALGMTIEAIAEAVPGLTLPPGRYERSRIGEIEIIFDAYNASMSGTLATLHSFGSEPAGRRIAVLGSMAELGDEAPLMHERVGEVAAHMQIDVLLVGGLHAEDLSRGARDGGLAQECIVPFASNEAAAGWLRANIRAGDLVLFKGSRRYKLEEIVQELRGEPRVTHAH